MMVFGSVFDLSEFLSASLRHVSWPRLTAPGAGRTASTGAKSSGRRRAVAGSRGGARGARGAGSGARGAGPGAGSGEGGGFDGSCGGRGSKERTA